MRLPFPRTLAARLILLAVAALLIAQIISLCLLYIQSQSQWRAMSVAPAVIRILDAAEGTPSQSRFVEQFIPPVETRDGPPALPAGEESPAHAQRAQEMLANAGLRVRTVRVWIEHRRRPGRPELRRMIEPHMREGRDRAMVTLAVELASGRWLVATSRTRNAPPPFIAELLLQTLAIFAAMLLPLLWIGRRLTAPLGTLAQEAQAWRPTHAATPLPERGATDLRELTRAFNDMRGRIAAMLAEKDHMLGAIGHDLRTPLASLRVRVESVEDDDERAAMVSTIEDMNHMLEDILALARVGRERQPPQKLDLASLAEAVMEDFTAMGADVTIARSERAVATVHGAALRRALRNLIDNALKYGVRARVSVQVAQDTACLSVEDDGPGIDPDRIAEMLEPFTRLERSRNRETGGSGLGLALVKAVVEAEGGTLVLANRTDGSTGLVAEIRLPLG